jgi:hypothetical protein
MYVLADKRYEVARIFLLSGLEIHLMRLKHVRCGTGTAVRNKVKRILISTSGCLLTRYTRIVAREDAGRLDGLLAGKGAPMQTLADDAAKVRVE